MNNQINSLVVQWVIAIERQVENCFYEFYFYYIFYDSIVFYILDLVLKANLYNIPALKMHKRSLKFTNLNLILEQKTSKCYNMV